MKKLTLALLIVGLSSSLFAQKNDSNKYFTFSNIIFLDVFKNIIEEKSKLKYNRSSTKNNIEITYSGEIEKIESYDLYFYSGGYINILIDKILCVTLDDLEIEKTWYGGNPKSAVEKDIRDQIKKIVNENKNLIVASILKCIK